jgi:hypothetical protein
MAAKLQTSNAKLQRISKHQATNSPAKGETKFETKWAQTVRLRGLFFQGIWLAAMTQTNVYAT